MDNFAATFLTSVLAIVDDSERPAVTALLEAIGVGVAVVPSVPSALRLLKHQRFDATVIGESLLRTRAPGFVGVLRGVAHWPMVMIGSPDSEQVVQAFQTGADDYVSWSVDPRVLKARLEALLSLYRHSTGGAS